MHPAIAAIERRREAAGLSIREIESRAELGHSTYAKLVNGTTGEPKLPLIEAVAAAFDWPLAELLGVTAPAGDVLRLDPRQLVPSPLNPRRHYDEEAIEALALSIEQRGLLQNLVVRPMTDAEQRSLAATHPPAAQREAADAADAASRFYWIVAGERRWRAISWLVAKGRWPVPATPDGLLPCRAVLAGEGADDPEEEHRVLALLENLQREYLSPLDAGRAFQALQQRGWSTASLAQAVHKTDRYVQQRLALLNLTPQAQEALDGETITFSQARALARANPSEQPELLERIADGDLVTEHEIDEHAKYLGRAHAGDTGSAAGNGKVLQLDNPAAGSGGGAAPTQFMKDAAADYRAKHPEGYQRPGTESDDGEEDETEEEAKPVPPVVLNSDRWPLADELLARLQAAVAPMLPAEAAHGDWISIGHPDLAPAAVEIEADSWHVEPPGWTIQAYTNAKGQHVAYYQRSATVDGLVAVLEPLLDKGPQCLEREVDAERRAELLAKAKESEGRFDRVTGLQLDQLTSTQCRLLAAAAIELARCALREEQLRDADQAVDGHDGERWKRIQEAGKAAEEAQGRLIDLVLRNAEQQPPPAGAAPAPAGSEPASARRPDGAEASDVYTDPLLDIPPALRRA